MRTNRLVLVVPGLLRPLPPGADARWTSRVAPCLARLLAAAGSPTREPEGIDAALAAVYGVARQRDWPLAPIHARALGLDTGADCWLCADPVTLNAGRDNVRLDGAVTDLDAGDAGALLATLNAHFRDDGIAFVAPRPDRWFVRASVAPAITTRPLSAAVGQTLRDLLPTGPAAGQWRRWQDEIQMLMYDHPVNTAREAQGRAPVTGVWFWGGGTLPSPTRRSIRTFAASGAAVALAAFTRAPAAALPAALEGVLATASDGEAIVAALDQPPEPVSAEQALLAPAWRALGAGTVANVTLITDGDGDAMSWTAQRPSAWQRLAARWRVPDLAALLATARARLEAER